MKKIILLVCLVVSFAASAFAYDYDAQFKKSFYDNLINGMFASLEKTIVSNGYPKESAAEYVKTLKSRVDRTELENKTWSCISKHSMEEMTKNTALTDECFGDWANKFFSDNADALTILQK